MRTDLYGKESFYPMWWEIYNEALRGMNIGGNCDVHDSGEYLLMQYLSDSLKGGIVFDVGANVGDYSKMLAEMLENVSIHSFEPSNAAYAELSKNTADIKGIKINNIGLSNEKCVGTMYSNEEGSVLGSLYKRELGLFGISFENTEEVELDTLDNYCSQNHIQQIDFLKLDVEGNELMVLLGAEEMLKQRKIHRIQFEFGGCNIDSRTFFRDFWMILSNDYDIFRIMKDGLWQITNYSEQLEIFTYSNFFCIQKGMEL